MIQADIQYPQPAVLQYYQEVQSPLFISIDSISLDISTTETLNEIRPSGVTLFLKNVDTYVQTKNLIEQIHQYGQELGIEIKVAIDEEGGVVSRLNRLPEYPAFNGARASNYIAQKEEHSKFLSELGIDINLAPVADVGFLPDSPMYIRTLASTPQDASSLVGQTVSSDQDQGVSTTLKHFPGLGRTEFDTHYNMSDVNIPYELWLSTDAVPFSSNLNSDYIMTGHVKYPQIDSKIASISHKWITEILREELGYRGGIISDDLKMGGLEVSPNEITCSDITHQNANKVKLALDAGTNYPLLVLSEEDHLETYRQWLEIEKDCL